MAWGKMAEVLGLIRTEVRGRLKQELVQESYDEVQVRMRPEIVEEAYTVTDARQQEALNLTPAQRLALHNLLAALDDGTATTLQHQRATAKLIRMQLREADPE